MNMDAIAATVALLFLSSLSISSETQLRTQIPLGSSLNPISHPSSWPSPSGLFAFGFYRNPQGSGFAVGIWLVGLKNNTVVWTANRDDPPFTSNATVRLTLDGKLLLQIEQRQVKSIANNSATASSASMLDSGNFVLYDKESNIIWQSFDYPTDTILGSQSLSSGCQLLSSSSDTNRSTGRFRLKMQVDGRLVLYPVNTADTSRDAYWDSNSHYSSLTYQTDQVCNVTKCHLYFNETGFLAIRNLSDLNVRILYDSSSSWDDNFNNRNQTIYRATLDYDGVFRLYVHVKNSRDNGKKVANWPDEKNACAVKGFCGFNSFCTFADDQPDCRCLPGFNFTDPNQHSLGCKRNFSIGGCRGGKDAAVYDMVTMMNIDWQDHPYLEVRMLQPEECSSSCLVDCNCWAALYQGGSCLKQGSPLRYVQRTMEDEYEDYTTSRAFLKVGKNSLGNYKSDDNKTAPEQPLIKSANKAMVQVITVTSGFIMLFCSTIAVSSHFIYKIRVLSYKRLMETGNLGLNEGAALVRFSYNELKRATNNFKQELGKGSFGAVYKGALHRGTRLIAVKRLEKLVEDGEREFQAEVRAIGKTHHRNLVHLLGYCVEGSKRLLVYEYMSNSSLAKLLFGAKRRPDWDDRVRIALEIARGLLYLHEECDAPIIHCDIKPQNILIDEFWTAKISDFGLAKLLMPDQTRTFTGVRGTRGYVAPEWHKNTPISVKADVYSYGVVLLEILCCRRNIEINVSQPEEIVLSSWAYKCFVSRELDKLVLWETMDRMVLENMLKVAFWCIQDEPVLRPTIKSVVLMLEGVTDIAIPPCPTSNSV